MSDSLDLARSLDSWDQNHSAESAVSVLTAATDCESSEAALWQRFLETTGEHPYLSLLPGREQREAWSAIMFKALRWADYGLESLLDWRVRTRPDTIYLQDLGRTGEPALTYAQTQRQARLIAAHLLGPNADQPRSCVGILSANSLDSALCDLACLIHDIPVAPMNIHEDVATLAWICDRLGIADLIVDTPDRLQRAMEIRDRTKQPLNLHLLTAGATTPAPGVSFLNAELGSLSDEEAERRLARRPRFGLDDPCTVLFTSGSTGKPKGITFTPYNLVSKRFARAAALPEVGHDEVLLAFLPLYHTFGRFLELMGMLFWGGTYVFVGNPSLDTLLAGMPRVRPTGMISVPMRWQQICDKAGEQGNDRAALDEITGGQLRWGLSAAGWLSPDTFRWYQSRGVDLCSGFGMTEGTGGLTMTPPGNYLEESVGLPLPGVRIRLGDLGELQVAGPYVAYYLPEDGPVGDLTAKESDRTGEYWLGTGDLFRELPDGHLQIVDRIKDIYKNNRGQTVAPRKVETRFTGVPGIKRTFLAGDGRAANVLLIVPDPDDTMFSELDPIEREDYLRRVIRQANLDLTSYERVVSFALLDRDFDTEHGELTAKGSLRRKAIEHNFKDVLDGLYRRRTLSWQGRRLVVPRWVIRELGVLEDEIQLDGDSLINSRAGSRLPLAVGSRPGWVRIGDLEYRPTDPDQEIDLGLFARQPLLWAGNPSLQAFLPCRNGWDTPLIGVDEQVLLPPRDADTGGTVCPARRSGRLGELDIHILDALFADLETALDAVAHLEKELATSLPREALLIRRRLEALACHPLLAIRCEVYRILVLDDPEPDYGRHLAAFVDSGRPFLCANTIAAIAHGASESRRLFSFRRRLHAYRQQLDWPASPATRTIFSDLLRLLADFARTKPENMSTVRRELLCWSLFKRDPELAELAGGLQRELTAWHRDLLESSAPDPEAWRGRLAFQEGLADDEISRLESVLIGTTLLAESVALVFDTTLNPADLPPSGIWISRTTSQPFPSRYRISINTESGRHFDLLLILREDLGDSEVMETFHRVAAIRAWPSATPVLPRLGALRTDLGVATMAFANGLTVWDRIRLNGSTPADAAAEGKRGWRRLLVSGMTTVLSAWHHSGKVTVPGMITPSNVLVPDRDWREGSKMISLAGWSTYHEPLDLARPLIKNFLLLPVSHYPALKGMVDHDWLAEAAAEALGPVDGRNFLIELANNLESSPQPELGPDLASRLRLFAQGLADRYRPTLAVEGAVERYNAWRMANPDSSPRARSDQIEALGRLYRLDLEGEPAQFTLFGECYLTEETETARQACDRLVDRLFRHPGLRAARTVELSDLQAALASAEDRDALGRLAFPHSGIGHHPALQAVGDRAREHVVLQTEVLDDREHKYMTREPRDAAEMGRLYRLFLQSGFPLEISESDNHLVTVDSDGQMTGGVVWRLDAAGEPHLDGVAVVPSRRGHGLARSILEDFASRLRDDGYTHLRTHYSLKDFFEHLGFATDRQRGGLVRHLG